MFQSTLCVGRLLVDHDNAGNTIRNTSAKKTPKEETWNLEMLQCTADTELVPILTLTLSLILQLQTQSFALHLQHCNCYNRI